MKVIRNDLGSFLDKLKERAKMTKTANKDLVKYIADKGAEYADKLYAENAFNASVTTQSTKDGNAKIVVVADGLWFHEYGTGWYATDELGEGGYPGKLPSSGVPITGYWHYYYPNPRTKRMLNGKHGWYIPAEKNGGEKVFTTGQPSHAELYFTRIHLENRLLQYATEFYRERSNK